MFVSFGKVIAKPSVGMQRVMKAPIRYLPSSKIFELIQYLKKKAKELKRDELEYCAYWIDFCFTFATRGSELCFMSTHDFIKSKQHEGNDIVIRMRKTLKSK
jgi:hypothetical protein